MAIARYPRRGDRLAPLALREILEQRVPAKLLGEKAGRGVLFCDLDEAYWDRLSRPQIERLSAMIVARVRNKDTNQLIAHRHLPRAPEEMKLEDLCLENRTYNCLRREGFADDPQRLAGMTLGEALGIRAFGARCLVDLLTALETYLARRGVLDERLTVEADRLAEIPDALTIRRDDPRLGPYLRAIDGDARSVKDLVDSIRQRRLDPPDAFRMADDIAVLRAKAAACCEQSLEEELVQIFTPGTKPRNRRIVAEYYGWDGGAGGTLKELGRRHGLTRERIRQVCAKAVRDKQGLKFYSPVYRRARGLVVRRLPATVVSIEAELAAKGLVRRGMRLASFANALEFLSKRPPLAVVQINATQLAVAPDQVELPKAIVEAAKKAIFNYGLTTVAAVGEELAGHAAGPPAAALVAASLQTLDDFHWLDESGGWFHLGTHAAHGLPKLLDKFLAVVGDTSLKELHTAVRRHRRMRQVAPPRTVLAEYCRQAPGVNVEGNRVIADPPRNWREALTGIEATMVGLLKTHGPVMERGALEDLCIEHGINRSSFNVYLMHSPILAQYGRSVYGLPGLKVSARQVEAIAGAAATRGAGPKVLEGYGWLDERRIWLGYRLSRGIIGSGVITVPAALKNIIQGRYQLSGRDGDPVGTLVMKKDSGWGMSPFIRRQGGRQGDYILITLDLAARTATIDIGDQTVLDQVAHEV